MINRHRLLIIYLFACGIYLFYTIQAHAHGYSGYPMHGQHRYQMHSEYYDYSGELNLSKEQQKEFDYIHDKTRHQVRSLENRISDLSEKLDKLYEAERPDVEKISGLHNKIHEIERQIIELRIKSRNQKYDLLNKEQREIFSRRHHQMHDDDYHHHGGHMNMNHMMR